MSRALKYLPGRLRQPFGDARKKRKKETQEKAGLLFSPPLDGQRRSRFRDGCFGARRMLTLREAS